MKQSALITIVEHPCRSFERELSLLEPRMKAKERELRTSYWSRWTLLVSLLLVVGGCATRNAQRDQPPRFPAPSVLTALSTSSSPLLKARIDSLIPDSLFPPAQIGLKIVSLRSGETLYELNSFFLFNPASNQKLFTAAAALATLGEEFPLSTVVSVDTVSGTIFLKGYGDPLFDSTSMDSLARATAAALPGNRTWRVAGDASYFDSTYWGFGWNWDDEPEPYQPFLTPLMFNGNAIRLIAGPGLYPGAALTVRTEPPTRFVSLQNNGKTARDSIRTRLKLSRVLRERHNILTIEGEMLPGTPEASTTVSVWQPALYTTHVFAERLERLGIAVGSIVLDTVSAAAMQVARVAHRLDSVVTYMNKESDNLCAEALLRVLGAEVTKMPGSARSGIGVMKNVLALCDVDTAALVLADGSGLSRMNLASPSAVVQLLKAMYNTPHFASFARSLAIAGIDGTIGSRMKGTAAEGNLRGKTGTLTAVSSLSGYLHTADGELLAFSLMMMNYPSEAGVYRQVQDGIGVFLTRLRRESF
jgi:D-alanyl-D-alanine carboxypeptidase/D-alanyl-D-alanine-endopeptidase (penicillin-binding protein 4)